MGRSIKLLFLLCYFLRHAQGVRVKNITSAVARQIRSISYPSATGMGIFFALAIPIDVPEKSVAVAMYFEANYLLPDEKSSNYFDDQFTTTSFSRQMAYDVFENNLNRAGFPGRVCLLRTICEAAKEPVTNNGLIGDIVHILLTPSSSHNANLSADFSTAETATNCSDLYNGCPVNLLDLVSRETN